MSPTYTELNFIRTKAFADCGKIPCNEWSGLFCLGRVADAKCFKSKYPKNENDTFRFLPEWGSSKGRKPLANLNEKKVGTTFFLMSPTYADKKIVRVSAYAYRERFSA